MKKLFSIAAIALALLSPPAANARAIEDGCSVLPERIASCTPYSCTRPDTDHPGRNVLHHVVGPMEQDKTLCHVTETMQGNKILSCKHTTESLAAASRMVANTLSGNTEVNKDDQAIIMAAWNQNFCEIFDERVGIYHE
jgi:hypothetical protein